MANAPPDPVESRPVAGGSALLIIDMINDLAFPGGGRLKPKAMAAALTILSLREAADRFGMPVIYVNDNYGQWRSERSQIIARCGAADSRGRELIELLAPRDGDYFVIKPQFSGFYATPLPTLLPKLGVNRLVLTGIAADICVLFTAADAHMRDYDLWVPKDAVASESDVRTTWALEIIQKSMDAEIRGADTLSLQAWMGASDH